MLAILFLCTACLLAAADAPAPYDRLLPQASVWSQEIDVRTIDVARPVEYRETLGVFPIGNGRCFTYAGLGIPQNTLFMITGPRYQTEGDHNPMGAFGEVDMSLTDAGTPVELPLQSCRTVRGAPVVLTCERSERMRLTTVTAAPPGTTAILRWFTIERLDSATGDVSVVFTLRGPAPQKDDEGLFVEYRHGKWTERMRPLVIGRKLEERDGKLGFTVPQVAKGAPHTFVLALLCLGLAGRARGAQGEGAPRPRAHAHRHARLVEHEARVDASRFKRRPAVRRSHRGAQSAPPRSAGCPGRRLPDGQFQGGVAARLQRPHSRLPRDGALRRGAPPPDLLPPDFGAPQVHGAAVPPGSGCRGGPRSYARAVGDNRHRSLRSALVRRHSACLVARCHGRQEPY